MSQSNTAPVALFNTLTRSIEPFKPLVAGKVGIYCCGPTVYDFQHIGNFKTFIFEDVLVRMLRHAGYEVNHVMNITDVGHQVGDADDGEDKMSVAKRREKKSSAEVARFYTDKFFEDWDALGLRRPDIVCKATDHIADMITLIHRLEENGFAYVANGNVYFDVMRFETYGKMAKLDLRQLQAGARIEVDPHKRSPFDFALWFTNSKFSDQELQWDSPWGRGYPGWHIECSAMSLTYLGEQFDIHCGGIDHIPVHHTNEIAQTEAATGKPWVNLWMHSEFILLNGEKMAKSKGGFLVLDDLVAQGFEPLSYRMLVLSANYRQQLNFGLEAMQNAQRALEKLRAGIVRLKAQVREPLSGFSMDSLSDLALKYRDEFCAAIRHDLNTAVGLSVLWKVLHDRELSSEEQLTLLYDMDNVFGLDIAKFKATVVSAPAEALELLEKRNQARTNKNWPEADKLRDTLKEMGWVIEDSANGSLLKPIA